MALLVFFCTSGISRGDLVKDDEEESYGGHKNHQAQYEYDHERNVRRRRLEKLLEEGVKEDHAAYQEVGMGSLMLGH